MTISTLLSTILFLLSSTVFAADKHAANELHMGSVAMDTPVEMVKRLTPLIQYLHEKTGYRIIFRASPNLDSAVEDLGRGSTQIAYLTPAAYLEAREIYAVAPLVSPISKGKTTFTLMVMVNKGSPYQNLADLRGKKFAFGDKKAVLQPAVLTYANFKLEDFSTFEFLNHYDNIAKAVINGDFDAGILKDTIAEKYAAQGLRVIHTSPPLPSYIFAVNKNLSPAIAAKLKNVLLELKNNTAAHQAILTSLEKGYEGFSASSDKDYDGIRKMLGLSKAGK